jgi:hypothetical protein
MDDGIVLFPKERRGNSNPGCRRHGEVSVPGALGSSLPRVERGRMAAPSRCVLVGGRASTRPGEARYPRGGCCCSHLWRAFFMQRLVVCRFRYVQGVCPKTPMSSSGGGDYGGALMKVQGWSVRWSSLCSSGVGWSCKVTGCTWCSN